MRGETELLASHLTPTQYFNPLSPCGERHVAGSQKNTGSRFQSTLPMRGETPAKTVNYETLVFQSTLPMRGETPWDGVFYFERGFQSTLPMRGETMTACTASSRYADFNPLSPCGERPWH